MYLRTLSWSVVSSKYTDVPPAIQIFCVDENGRSVYVRFPALSTYIMEFKNDINEEIINVLQPQNIYYSAVNEQAIELRSPSFKQYDSIKDKISAFEKDPQGLLASFWESKNIKPYSWIYVEQYQLLTKKVSKCDVEIKTQEEFVFATEDDYPIITKKLFWDIEVYSPDRNFTDATNLAHEIFMISAVSLINNVIQPYILTTKNTDTFSEAIFQIYATEKELLERFFQLWDKVDRCITYNGDSYDIPYILDRAKLLKVNIGSLGKLLLPSSVIRAQHPSPLGYEWDKTVISTGTEKLDLINYFRRFHPGEENYKLETIGSAYIGEGKSGLEIEDMFKIIESNDSKRMKEVAWYSYQDSVLLYDLWNKLNLEDHIEELCNDIGCTSEELLRLTEKELLTRLFYFVDFGIVTYGKINLDKIDYYKSFELKVYHNIFVYNYDELFDSALSINNSDYDTLLRDRIKYLPTEMKAMAFYSNYVSDDIKMEFQKQMKNIKSIAITKQHLFTLTSHDNLTLINKYDYLFVITQSSTISVQNNVIKRKGLHKICRPKFDYARIAVDDYINDYINNKKVIGRRVTVKDLEKLDINLFIVTDKVKPLSSYKDKSNIKYKLAETVEGDFENTTITTWIRVKYYHTKEGVKLVKPGIEYQLDYQYYVKELNDNYKTLDNVAKR